MHRVLCARGKKRTYLDNILLIANVHQFSCLNYLRVEKEKKIGDQVVIMKDLVSSSYFICFNATSTTSNHFHATKKTRQIESNYPAKINKDSRPVGNAFQTIQEVKLLTRIKWSKSNIKIFSFFLFFFPNVFLQKAKAIELDRTCDQTSSGGFSMSFGHFTEHMVYTTQLPHLLVIILPWFHAKAGHFFN